ncbi:MAG: hypothetical protein MGG11_08555 [Trichodesmium sp. MAG_R03]|nr:hypothetical protein [Trichodesmium sp. MAG_R03]
MATIPELEANLLKMQQLLKAAQNKIQKKTFQDIINNLSQQLEREKFKLNSPKTENLTLDQLPEKEITKQLVQQGQTETEKDQKSSPKSESQIEAKSEVEVEEKLENHEDENLLPKQDYVFQGLGVLYGKIIKRYEDNENYYNAIVKDKTYELIIVNPRVRDFLKADYNPEKNRYLTVYPNLVHYPQPRGGTKAPKINFTIIAANDLPNLELKPNEFKLFGLWQFIGVSKCPVMSIHRNRKKDGSDRVSTLKEKFKDNDKLHKNLTRANHVPLLWKNSPVKPFRFNPKLDKDKQGDRYFCQVKARFLADRGVWGFQELLVEPTLDIPRFYKPIKVAPTKKD